MFKCYWYDTLGIVFKIRSILVILISSFRYLWYLLLFVWYLSFFFHSLSSSFVRGGCFWPRDRRPRCGLRRLRCGHRVVASWPGIWASSVTWQRRKRKPKKNTDQSQTFHDTEIDWTSIGNGNRNWICLGIHRLILIQFAHLHTSTHPLNDIVGPLRYVSGAVHFSAQL